MRPSEEELQLKKESDECLDELRALQEKVQAAEKNWRQARDKYEVVAKRRLPEAAELVYAYAKCDCGAHMAYRRMVSDREWVCSEVLLGIVGTPEDKAIMIDRTSSAFGGKPVELPEELKGKQTHVVMPFAFWKVKEDPSRHTPRD